MGGEPLVWMLLGDKRGDNAQVEVLAESLGWSCQRREIRMREPWVIGKPRVKPTLHHVDLSRSDPLEPPWPDLILTIGRRPSMASLWVREQSGGHTKIALLGKPSGMTEHFDLIVVSAEAQLPPLPNVMCIGLPLLRADEQALAAAADKWREPFAVLPRPLIGILIGGPTGPFVYDASVGRRLLDRTAEVIADGGTPYLTTSRRTPENLVKRLEAELPQGAQLFQWAPDRADNPYLGLLAHGDGFVVTGDSISMLVEVARRGRPLGILSLPHGALGGLDLLRRAFLRRLFAPGSGSSADRRRRLALTLHRMRLVSHTRDFRALHGLLVESGFAVRDGERLEEPSGRVPDDLPQVVARVRALLEAT